MAALYYIFSFLSILGLARFAGPTATTNNNALLVKKSGDFVIQGNGTNENWGKTTWINIPRLSNDKVGYATKAKLLYSDTGLYLLLFCEDKKVTATMQADFLDLWNEDVIEIFVQPDSTAAAYFEYELSPLNYELPICIFNEKGKLNSWVPFHYEKDRKTRHEVTIQDGSRKSNAKIKSWTSEIFIPFALLKPIMKNVPVSGTRWKGNLNRIDYDQGETLWSWQKNSGDFHEYQNFGTFQFE